MLRLSNNRIGMVMGSLAGLMLVYLFQRFQVAGLIGVKDVMWSFVINRSIRFILNDLFTIILIYALFFERKYVLFAIYVQIIGMILILFPYFIIKFNYPAYNGPLISFLHRLVLNPIVLMLLIPAFYYQQNLKRT